MAGAGSHVLLPVFCSFTSHANRGAVLFLGPRHAAALPVQVLPGECVGHHGGADRSGQAEQLDQPGRERAQVPPLVFARPALLPLPRELQDW